MPRPGASVEYVATSASASLRVASTGHGSPLLLINGLA
jgi:hypothetical protein